MSVSPKKDRPSEHKPSLWQPPERREQMSEEAKRWREENADAIKAWNEWVEKNGLPLAKYRMF